ncbi:MAG: hypothetical protein ABGZ17_11135, partial [Planctomycetaceae bacterium]
TDIIPSSGATQPIGTAMNFATPNSWFSVVNPAYVTEGFKGAGTPDLVSPGLGCVRDHTRLDVCSWACCNDAGMLKDYFKRWKPRGCSK